MNCLQKTAIQNTPGLWQWLDCLQKIATGTNQGMWVCGKRMSCPKSTAIQNNQGM